VAEGKQSYFLLLLLLLLYVHVLQQVLLAHVLGKYMLAPFQSEHRYHRLTQPDFPAVNYVPSVSYTDERMAPA
jgi:hypothetical protein